MDEYKTLSAGKYWLEQGWYTAKQLQDIINVHNRMNEQLHKSMQPTKEKKNERRISNQFTRHCSNSRRNA